MASGFSEPLRRILLYIFFKIREGAVGRLPIWTNKKNIRSGPFSNLFLRSGRVAFLCALCLGDRPTPKAPILWDQKKLGK
eukprot:s627_g27.t1